MIKTLLVIILSVCLFLTKDVLSNDVEITNKVKDSVQEVFGSEQIQSSRKIRIKIVNLQKLSDGKTFVESDEVVVRFAYTGPGTEAELIGIFLEGNKNPLVAKIIPGKSSGRKLNFVVRAKIENFCYKNNNVLVIVKANKKLLANRVSFYSFISDCGAH